MKKFIYLILSITLTINFSMASSETMIINMEKQGFAPEFMSAFKKTYAKGPNFNTNDFVLTYPCGGGAICGSIFDCIETKGMNNSKR